MLEITGCYDGFSDIAAGLFFAKPMREAGYITMIDPFQEKLGDWMGALLVLPAVCGEIFWSAAILGALGTFCTVLKIIYLVINK